MSSELDFRLRDLQMLKHMWSRHIVAFLLGCSAVGAHSSSAQEAQGVTPKSGFVTTPDGIKIHYLEAGPAEHVTNSPAILFVPGWTMPADIWEYQIRYFSRRHRVVAMEPRSYGLSSQTTEANYPEAHARDVQAVLDRLQLRPAVLVGWSLGVEDVLAYIDQFGTNGVPALVLVDELLVFQRDSDFMNGYFDFSWNLQKDRPATTAKFVRRMYKKPQTEEYLQRITTEAMHTPTNTAIALLDAWVARDRAPMLAKVDKPTLIVASSYGGHLALKNHEDIQRRIRGSRFEFFEDASHALFVDDADRFNALLNDFFERISR
jgi:microsomal epoxide hydrolase